MPAATCSVTVVQGIDIACSVDKAISFMYDAQQWLPWALPGVESVLPLPFGQWLVKTSHGLGKLRPLADPLRGLVDYEWVLPNHDSWRVPVRVQPTATGCHLAVKFVKPDDVPVAEFQSSMLHTAEGLHTLKLVLEQD